MAYVKQVRGDHRKAIEYYERGLAVLPGRQLSFAVDAGRGETGKGALSPLTPFLFVQKTMLSAVGRR